MSIEQTFERIAVALEQQVELLKISLNAGVNVETTGVEALPIEPESPAPKVSKKTKKTTEQAVAVESDLPGIPAEQPIAKEAEQANGPTYKQMEDLLRQHAAKFSIPVTKKLMIEHGANATVPTIASIPKESYAKLHPILVKEVGAK